MRQVYVNVSYLFLYDEDELNGREASNEELEARAEARVNELLSEVTVRCRCWSDMEIEVCEEGE